MYKTSNTFLAHREYLPNISYISLTDDREHLYIILLSIMWYVSDLPPCYQRFWCKEPWTHVRNSSSITSRGIIA